MEHKNAIQIGRRAAHFDNGMRALLTPYLAEFFGYVGESDTEGVVVITSLFHDERFGDNAGFIVLGDYYTVDAFRAAPLLTRSNKRLRSSPLIVIMEPARKVYVDRSTHAGSEFRLQTVRTIALRHAVEHAIWPSDVRAPLGDYLLQSENRRGPYAYETPFHVCTTSLDASVQQHLSDRQNDLGAVPTFALPAIHAAAALFPSQKIRQVASFVTADK